MLQYSPKIVTDSLVMCLDASQNKSYPTTDLPVKGGLVMWMDAADDSTFSYSSGTTVSQWRDKSGFNYHMVPVSAGPTRNAFLNSRKVLAFTNTQDIQNLSIDLRTSAYSVFVVDRYTSPSSGTGRILTSNSGLNNWLLGHWASEVNKYYANGWIYSTYVALDTNWKLYLGDWGGPSNDLANFYGAGTAIATNSADAAAGPWGLGINANSGERSNCEAAEIIVFNRLLTATERRLVHTYLGQKWGISNTDRSIVDLSGFDDNGLLGDGTTANMPAFDYYNKGSLKFDGSNDYINIGNPSSVNFGNGDFTIEMWMTRNTNATTNLRVLGKGAESDVAGSAGYAFFGSDGGINFGVNPGAARTIISAATYSLGEWFHVVGVVQRGSTMRTYKNGVLVSSAAAPTGSVSNASINLNIGRSTESASLYWPGNIAIVRMYNKALSVNEVLQNYEAQKTRFINYIATNGLVLNLDAGNPYSYAGSGTTWYDVSGGGYNATIVNAPTFVSDSIKYFTCSSTQNFTISNPISSQPNLSQIWTVSAWVNIDTITGALARYLISGLNNGVAVEWYDSGTLLYLNGGANDYYTYGSSIEGSGWVYLTFLFRNSDGYRKIYNNLIDITTSGPNNTSTPAGNSATFTIADNMRGKIAQIMMYDRLLTVAEIAQNYNATKGRFGL
jgi:hypothetical protein